MHRFQEHFGARLAGANVGCRYREGKIRVQANLSNVRIAVGECGELLTVRDGIECVLGAIVKRNGIAPTYKHGKRLMRLGIRLRAP